MIPIIDGHNDALLRVWRHGGSLNERSDDGHLDVPRMREGGIAAGFFAVFVPARDDEPADPRSAVVPTDDGYEVPQEGPLPFERAARIADELVAIAERELTLVRTAGELRLDGEPLAILHFEGAEPIDPQLANLEGWYERGLRSLGLVWSRPNAFGHGVPFRYPGTPDTGPGLTARGKALVTTCNKLGILVDLAHATERTFFDTAALSTEPRPVWPTSTLPATTCSSTASTSSGSIETASASPTSRLYSATGSTIAARAASRPRCSRRR